MCTSAPTRLSSDKQTELVRWSQLPFLANAQASNPPSHQQEPAYSSEPPPKAWGRQVSPPRQRRFPDCFLLLSEFKHLRLGLGLGSGTS